MTLLIDQLAACHGQALFLRVAEQSVYARCELMEEVCGALSLSHLILEVDPDCDLDLRLS